tara:strand:- start:2479 stop:2724 length:246 start_codon:yes stop_codon:yes gene_type:complete
MARRKIPELIKGFTNTGEPIVDVLSEENRIKRDTKYLNIEFFEMSKDIQERIHAAYKEAASERGAGKSEVPPADVTQCNLW